MSNMTFACTCPKCDRSLSVPADLAEFSCMYCGERLNKGMFLTQVSEKDGHDAKQYFETHILRVITDHFGIDKKVTNAEYEEAFSAYRAANEATFEQLDTAVAAGCLTAEKAANLFLDQLEQLWQEDHGRKMRRNTMVDTDKFVIAVFLVPMVRELNLPVSEGFCIALQKNWCARHPKSPFYLGTHDEMSAGFQKKLLGLCFITTAICSMEGKPDDCEELTAFRAFRDNYLRACPDGPGLIEQYYNIAPGILLHIDLDRDRTKIYQDLRSAYLQPCYEDIRHGRLEQCKQRYTAMVESLERKYLH